MNELIAACCSRAIHVYTKAWRGGAWLAAIILLVLSASPLSANEPGTLDEVGRVTLVIGQAFAHNKKGGQRPLKRGDAVYVDETIETSAGGHVHLRFVDEGTVSVRPNSRLRIELYHYDKLQPKNSAIRFYLEAGVIRSISGKATEAAHDRFRLNTPITAIGVLGTDFVVRVEPEKMWAGVYSGAIAIAPISDQCPVNALGACGGATLLSEAMGGVMIEYSGSKAREKIVPLDPSVLSKEGHSGGNTSNQSTESAPVERGRINAAEMKAADVITRLDGVPQLVGVSQPNQHPSPFVWARWGGQLPGDNVSRPYAEVRDGRSVTVGDNYFVLFRSPSAVSELEPRAGAYDFKLTQGQVYFVGNGVSWLPQSSTPAQLDAATLRIDFAQRQFNTHLQMSYPQVGTANLDLSGPIQNNGIFGMQDTNGKVVGSLSTDGANAGMLFQREVQLGTFHGLTDWTQK